MGNKVNRSKKKKGWRKKNAKCLHEKIKKRRREQELAGVAGDQQPSEQSQEAAQPLTYKEWVASLAKSTASAVVETPPSAPPPPEQIPTPGPSTSFATESHTMTFRDWVAAQTAKAATETADTTTTNESAGTLSIYLTEPEISSVVVKEEVDADDHNMNEDVFASTGQAMDTLIVEFGDTSFDQDDMNSSTGIIDKTNSSKPMKYAKKKDLPSNTEKRRSLRDRNSLLLKALSKQSPKKTQSKPKLKTKQRTNSNDEPSLLVKKPRRRKIRKIDAATTTEGLITLRSEGTSTEDLEIVKRERSESEDRELFFKLCDKFLDEAATAAIRLTVSSKTDSGW